MKFAIVTPSFNRAMFLDTTIESVVSQAGEFEIDYVVQQASDDAAVGDILERWERRIADGGFKPRCRALQFRVIRERDEGMYDGINRGFSRSDAEIMAWINSDDLYHPGAFAVAHEVFARHSQVHWIVGIPNAVNVAGSITGYDAFPKAYSREFIQRGLHRVENHRHGLHWIPQDSVFWRRDLWNAAGAKLDATYRYAADFALWRAFSRHAELVKVHAMLGAYRFHGDQVTADPEKYKSEIGTCPRPPLGWNMLALMQQTTPLTEKLIFGHSFSSTLLRLFGLRWQSVVAHRAVWSHERQAWELYLSPVL